MAESITLDSASTYWLDDSGLKITLQHKNSFGDVVTAAVLNSDRETTDIVWKHLKNAFHCGQRSKMDEIKRVLEIR